MDVTPDPQTDIPPFAMPRALWKLMLDRGYSSEEQLESLIHSSLKTLASPFTLDHMDQAVERLIEAFKKQEKICAYADFDLDGTPGLALFLQGLELLGFKEVVGYQPNRLTEGYGLHVEAVEKKHEEGVSLVVTIDLGITAVEAVARANELGVDVIITDHHLAKEQLPEAVAIVNPNKGTCESGLTYLCGTGVAFYLILALRMKMREQGLLVNDFDPKCLLDCFAIGTLTDLVPLVKENRILVKHGLVELANTKRPGLQLLLKKLKLDGRPLTAQDTAIRFAPKLNALSRMEMGLRPIDLFLVKDKDKAKTMVEEVIECNEMRLRLQKEAQQEAIEKVEFQKDQSYFWVHSKNFHKGIVGLVATKLATEFGKPAFVGSENEEGSIHGSARVPKNSGISVVKALDSAQNSLVQYGGHAPAAGFHLSNKTAEDFDQALSKHFLEQGENAESALQKTFEYDQELTLEQLNTDFMKWFDRLSPFGVDFEPPKFRVNHLHIEEAKELKGGHLRFKLSSGHSTKSVQGVWFFPDFTLENAPFGLEQAVDVVFEPQWNYFAGRKSLQILISDMRLSAQEES